MDPKKTEIQVAGAAVGNTLIWTKPTFEQVKMDAEIGSYNEETDPAREDE